MFLRHLYERYWQSHYSGVFRPIPLPCAGKLYTSPMPFGAYDARKQLIRAYCQFKIDHVFMLVTDEELKKKARRNLPKQYAAHGITYSQYPFKDFQAPAKSMLNDFVHEALERLQTQSVAVHCHAGVGRTAIGVACVAKSLLGCSTDEVLRFVQNHMATNLTKSQERIIAEFHV